MTEAEVKELKGLHSTLSRTLRSLERAKTDLEGSLKQVKDSENPQEFLSVLKADETTLREVRTEVKDLIVNFEQKVSVMDPNPYEADLQRWEDQDFAAQRLVNRAAQVVSDLTPAALPRSNSWVSVAQSVNSENQDLNANFSRLLSALEAQNERQSSQTEQNGGAARLPKLELPKFSGDPLKWRSFWDRFDASVGQNKKIASVDKLNYLMSQVEEEPLLMINTLPMTNEGYDTAVAMLKSQYEDSKMTIALLYRKLSDMKPVKNDTPSLRRYIAEIDCVLGSLTALGQDVTDDNLATLILSKLPKTVVMLMEMGKEVSDPWTVTLVRQKLSDYLVRVDRADKISASAGGGKKDGSDGFTADGLFAGEHKGKSKGAKGGKGAKSGENVKKEPPKGRDSGKPPYTGGASYQPGERKPYCLFCEGAHWPDMCKKMKTADERFRFLRNQGRCLICLKPGHAKLNCTVERPCYHCGKVKSHNSCLCWEKFGNGSPGESSHTASEHKNNGDTGEKGGGSALLAAGEQVSLQTALVPILTKEGKFVMKRGLLDPGCNRTYGSSRLAKQLGLKLKVGPALAVNRFGSDTPVRVPTHTTTMEIKCSGGNKVQVECSVIPKITGAITRAPVKSKNLNSLKRKFKLADTVPDAVEHADVDLLIGNDHYLDFVTGHKIEVEPGLYLLGSEFGYILSGRIPETRADDYGMAMCGITAVDLEGLDDIIAVQKADTVLLKQEQLSDYLTLEGIGITDRPGETTDARAVESFNEGVRYENGRYSVPLPRNEKISELTPDYNLCVGRLNSQVRKLKLNPEFFQKYDEIMQDQLKKGVIEKIMVKSDERRDVHYIPHHAVITPQKETTKVRIVYDGSAKVNHGTPSLNECLYRGPLLLEDLVGLLMRFRLHPIALISDIEKAFLQVGINEEDRDLLRFHWLKDPKNPTIDRNIEIYRFCRVIFGLNCSPSLLAQTIHHHLTKTGSKVSKKILDDLYVDNVVTGVQNVTEANEFYTEAKRIFDEASMNLREWGSNDETFMSQLPAKDQMKSRETKVLGLNWNMKADTLRVSSKTSMDPSKATTKRSILSQISSVFDPLGLFTPVTLPAKLTLQELSQSKPAWDETLPEHVLEEWEEQKRALAGISDVCLPRRISAGGKCSLVVFCDASSVSFATVVYLRSETGTTVETDLLFSKCRLNPVKKLTIPRMELLAVLIGVRAVRFVKSQLRQPLCEMLLLSDSQCALSWVSSQKCPDIFCRNRVSAIRKQPGLRFRYVNTKENPADWATRGRLASELDTFWWKGPEWIRKPWDLWPDWDFPEFVVRPAKGLPDKVHEASLVSDETVEASNSPLGIQAFKMSSHSRLVRVTAWCFRFLDRLKMKNVNQGPLSAEELQLAMVSWEKSEQEVHFGDVLVSIQEKKNHRLSKMGVFVDNDGILRCKGRLGLSDLAWESKYPKLLPHRSGYVRLLVKDVHQKMGHVAGNHLVNLLLQKYWIPRVKSVVAKVTRDCVVCKRALGKPYATPQMPELPKSRVTPSPCFSHTGVDYFGPVKIKEKESVVKAWICLYTCLATRAVHLEFMPDMSAKQFILGFKRFVSLRGKPVAVISDNGPQFKLAAEILKTPWTQVLSDDDVKTYFAETGMSWSFIPAYAPYMGGVYERMVGIVKQCLRKTLGKALLTAVEFQTVLCECEAIVNSRPLTYVGGNMETMEILTPAHFLNPNRFIGSPEIQIPEDSPASSAQLLAESWRKGQNLLNEFWKLWEGEYLNHLRSKNTYNHRRNSHLPQKPAEKDVVLIKCTGMPRGSWKLGQIDRLVRSPDGIVRSAQVKLPSGKVLHRPVNLLVPIEVSPDDEETNEVRQSTGSKESSNAEKDKDSQEKQDDTLDTKRQVVFAKLKFHAKWPAQVITDLASTPLAALNAPKGAVPVKFFQTGRYAYVPRGGISEFDMNTSKAPRRNDEDWVEAMRQAATVLTQNLKTQPA